MSKQTQPGTVIRTLRNEAGWTQETLAKRARLSRAHLCRIETGENTPRLDTLARIAKALGTDTVNLIAA